jgi:hypothetical protein
MPRQAVDEMRARNVGVQLLEFVRPVDVAFGSRDIEERPSVATNEPATVVALDPGLDSAQLGDELR